jgi:hypothetical protein
MCIKKTLNMPKEKSSYFSAQNVGNFAELHHGDPMEGYSLHVKADQSLKKHR